MNNEHTVITKCQPKIAAWFEAIGRTEEHTHNFDWPEGESDPRAHVAKQLVEYALRHSNLKNHPSKALDTTTPIVLVRADLDESPTAFIVMMDGLSAMYTYVETDEKSVVAYHLACLRARIDRAVAIASAHIDAVNKAVSDFNRFGDHYDYAAASLVHFAAERARLKKVRETLELHSDTDVNMKDDKHDQRA